MNKNFRNYLTVWAVLLALFNVIAFVSVGWADQEKYTASFWIGYAFISVCFAGQLVCAYRALKEDNLTKLFYNFSLLKTSYCGLVASFVFGGLCMLISPMPYWVGIILCAIVFAINVFSVVKASVAAETVSKTDEKTKSQTFFIRCLTANAENLIARAETEEIRAECRKVYEAVRYSDPMSSSALSAAEDRITMEFAALSEAVTMGNLAAVKTIAQETIILVEDRNRKCKLLK